MYKLEVVSYYLILTWLNSDITERSGPKHFRTRTLPCIFDWQVGSLGGKACFHMLTVLKFLCLASQINYKKDLIKHLNMKVMSDRHCGPGSNNARDDCSTIRKNAL